jgi:hypothetical protein
MLDRRARPAVGHYIPCKIPPFLNGTDGYDSTSVRPTHNKERGSQFYDSKNLATYIYAPIVKETLPHKMHKKG